MLADVNRQQTLVTQGFRIMATNVDILKLNFKPSEIFNRVFFSLLKLGPLCNAVRCRSFSEADCDFQRITEDKIPVVTNFAQIFKPGISFLEDIRDGKKQTLLDQEKIQALQILDEYLKEIDKHEKSLNKILRGHQSDGDKKMNSETDIIIAIAEHLLGKLSPGKSYIIDSKRKGKCRCGFPHCNSDPAFGSTGIGHEDVWHGDIDIVFSSPTGMPECIATLAQLPHVSSESSPDVVLEPDLPRKRRRTEDDNSENRKTEEVTYVKDEEPSEIFNGGKAICEVKVPSAVGAEDQAIAQIIVFSLLQKQKHEEFQHHLIPNILISPADFHIIMYDSVNDILLGSDPLQIFDEWTKSLTIETVTILWMVLHYRMFCGGIKVDALTDDCKNIDIKSDFRKIADKKWDVYAKSLKENISHFQMGEKKTSLAARCPWYAKELTFKD